MNESSIRKEFHVVEKGAPTIFLECFEEIESGIVALDEKLKKIYPVKSPDDRSIGESLYRLGQDWGDFLYKLRQSLKGRPAHLDFVSTLIRLLVCDHPCNWPSSSLEFKIKDIEVIECS